MDKPADCYWIMFSQRDSISTTLSPGVIAKGKAYFLKAKALKSAQHVGYAVVAHTKKIEVYTVSGKLAGVATSRAEAAAMIDSYHLKNNSDGYWMWAGRAFWNDGKVARPARRNDNPRT